MEGERPAPPPIPVARCARAEFCRPAADPAVAPWSGLQRHGLRANTPADTLLQGTGLWVGYDSLALHVLFVAEDAHPWATYTERDAPLYKEEVCEVFLDTEGDGLSYYEFEVNPNNAVLDGCMRRVRSGFRKDFRWRCEGLQTAARKFEGGWAAEFAIPFLSVAGHAPGPGTLWRANFTRIDRPPTLPRELSAWSPTGRPQFHVPERFGVLEFQ
ncbi:MAG: hypothetical protein EBS01_13200 [Verrucomicrobia bacterium]|nr:hypothetical protein [Verrucomicrobiota bacterium]